MLTELVTTLPIKKITIDIADVKRNNYEGQIVITKPIKEQGNLVLNEGKNDDGSWKESHTIAEGYHKVEKALSRVSLMLTQQKTLVVKSINIEY